MIHYQQLFDIGVYDGPADYVLAPLCASPKYFYPRTSRVVVAMLEDSAKVTCEGCLQKLARKTIDDATGNAHR